MASFELGLVVATRGAIKETEASGDNLLAFVRRHASGDWGDIDPADRGLNEQAVVDGSRILSVYKLRSGRVIWIITDAQDDRGRRRGTTILLPSEY